MRLNLADKIPETYLRGRLAEICRDIENQVNRLTEGRIAARHGAMSAAPTTGTWQQGDIVWHSAPTSGGNIGWVCTTAGTPGTWKAWGTIA